MDKGDNRDDIAGCGAAPLKRSYCTKEEIREMRGNFCRNCPYNPKTDKNKIAIRAKLARYNI